MSNLHRDRVHELYALRSFGKVPPKWSEKTITFHRKRKHIDADGNITTHGLATCAMYERPHDILGYYVERKHRPSERRGYVGEAYNVTHWRAKNPIKHGSEMKLVAMSNDGRTCYVQHSWQMGADSIIAVETIDFVSLFAAAFGIIARSGVAVAA